MVKNVLHTYHAIKNAGVDVKWIPYGSQNILFKNDKNGYTLPLSRRGEILVSVLKKHIEIKNSKDFLIKVEMFILVLSVGKLGLDILEILLKEIF